MGTLPRRAARSRGRDGEADTNDRRESFPSRILDRLRTDLRTRFVRGTLALQVGQGVGFLQSVVLWRLLGRAGFGSYASAELVFTLAFLLVNAGVQQASVGRLAAARARGDRDGIAGAMAGFLKAYGLMMLALLAVGGFAMDSIAWLFERDVASRARLAHLAWIFCWTAPAQAGFNLAALCLQGHRCMRDLAILEASTETAKTVLMIAAFLAGFGVEGAVGATVAGLALGSLGGLGMVRRLLRRESLPPLRSVLRRVPRARARDVFRTGIYLGFGKNVNLLKDLLPAAFLRAMLGELALADFRLAVKLTNYPLKAVLGVARNVLPKLAEDRVRYGPRAFRKTFWKISLYAGSIVGAATLVLLVMLPSVLVPWVYGPDAAAAVPLVMILAAGLLVAGVSVAIEPTYIVLERVRLAFAINIVGFLLLIAPGWVLVSRYGGAGAAAFAVGFQAIALVHLGTIEAMLRRAERGRAGGWAAPRGGAGSGPRADRGELG